MKSEDDENKWTEEKNGSNLRKRYKILNAIKNKQRERERKISIKNLSEKGRNRDCYSYVQYGFLK